MASTRPGSRAGWLALCEELVAGGLAHLTADGTAIALPGPPSKHGERSDGFEGFARVFLLYAFADASRASRVTAAQREVFLRGLDRGTAPGLDGEPAPWPEPDHGNAIANVASLALALRVLGRPFWDEMPEAVRDRVSAWLVRCGLHPTTSNNWVLFRCAIASFLRSVDRSTDELDAADAAARAAVEEWYDAASGWYSDGAEHTFDYYNAFEFHYLVPLLAHLDGDAIGIRHARERLDLVLASFDALVDAAGRPVYLGRSLGYRFAIASPYVMTAVLGGTALPPAIARRRAAAIIRSFLARGAVVDGVLERGWYGTHAALAQDYSGPAAGFFAGRVFAALLLPADHPFWSRRGGSRRRPRATVRAVGGATGLVIDPAPRATFTRLVNHGTNERVATVIRRKFDEPLYSRLAYSSVTAPVTVDDVLDRSFVWMVDGEPCGRGFIRASGSGPDWASSTGLLRQRTDEPIRTDPGAVRGRDLGAGLALLTVARDGWQLDVGVLSAPPSGLDRVSYGGWAVADAVEHAVSGTRISAAARSGTLETEVAAVTGFDTSGCHVAPGGEPFGAAVALPFLAGRGQRLASGAVVVAAASRLDARRRWPRRMAPPPWFGEVEVTPSGFRVVVRWARAHAVVELRDGVLRLDTP